MTFLGSSFLSSTANAGGRAGVLGLPSALLKLRPAGIPEIMVVGASNAGKSSLINALFGNPRVPLAKTSRKPVILSLFVNLR